MLLPLIPGPIPRHLPCQERSSGRAALGKAKEHRVEEWPPVKLDATPAALAIAPAPTLAPTRPASVTALASTKPSTRTTTASLEESSQEEGKREEEEERTHKAKEKGIGSEPAEDEKLRKPRGGRATAKASREEDEAAGRRWKALRNRGKRFQQPLHFHVRHTPGNGGPAATLGSLCFRTKEREHK
ncbi:hypothetical protein Cadr_000000974 [Camelus dromedarius]|uniref:Uncharacterized protein n=1 Tax=Camelus dromedarius TaxID=9838 RepID=A0A5N4EJ60_CAMDR|nr:hypothetical protein Cadr_000000974 [Camelus dromedarius]